MTLSSKFQRLFRVERLKVHNNLEPTQIRTVHRDCQNVNNYRSVECIEASIDTSIISTSERLNVIGKFRKL